MAACYLLIASFVARPSEFSAAAARGSPETWLGHMSQPTLGTRAGQHDRPSRSLLSLKDGVAGSVVSERAWIPQAELSSEAHAARSACPARLGRPGHRREEDHRSQRNPRQLSFPQGEVGLVHSILVAQQVSSQPPFPPAASLTLRLPTSAAVTSARSTALSLRSSTTSSLTPGSSSEYQTAGPSGWTSHLPSQPTTLSTAGPSWSCRSEFNPAPSALPHSS